LEFDTREERPRVIKSLGISRASVLGSRWTRCYTDFMRVSALFVSLLMAISTASQTKPAPKPAQAAPASSAALPTVQQIDQSLHRNFGYDSAITWEIFDVRAAEIPGMAEVILSMNRQNPIHLYVTRDLQWAIPGEPIPFGPDPYAPMRAQLRSADGPSRGAASPVIDIVVFSDLECPHCKAAEPVLSRLANDFPQVRIIFQQFPLEQIHPWSLLAAKYADCTARANGAGKDAFWKYVDAVFEHQDEMQVPTAEKQLQDIATAAGLNAQQLAACSATPDAASRVGKSITLGKALQVNETPTVFINGRRVKGLSSIPYENLTKLINFEIANAGK
jgi:protein-disulfide isomerase